MTSSQEYFMIVAKSLNMTQSAKELFISQQSLSYHISQLEKQYHTQLFVRKPALRLTQAGEHLLVRLEKLAKMERDIQAEMQDFSIVPQGELIVGMHPSRFNLLSPLVCPEFRRRVPGTRLKILPGTTSQFMSQYHVGCGRKNTDSWQKKRKSLQNGRGLIYMRLLIFRLWTVWSATASCRPI